MSELSKHSTSQSCVQAQHNNVMFIFVPDSRLGAPAIFVLLVAFLRKHTHWLSRVVEAILEYLFQRAALVHITKLISNFRSTERAKHILKRTFQPFLSNSFYWTKTKQYAIDFCKLKGQITLTTSSKRWLSPQTCNDPTTGHSHLSTQSIWQCHSSHRALQHTHLDSKSSKSSLSQATGFKTESCHPSLLFSQLGRSYPYPQV